MHKYILAILLILYSMRLSAQDNHEIMQQESSNFYIGFGVGPEFGLSLFLPKISYHKFFEYNRLTTYLGFEGTASIIGAGIYSVDALYGFKSSKFTFDTSIGVLWYPELDEFGPFLHSTLNPKIGLKLGNFWLKGGPSFFIYKRYSEAPPDVLKWIKIGSLSYNVELLINFSALR